MCLEREKVQCPACGPSPSVTIAHRKEPGRKETYAIVRCRICGMAFVSPRRALALRQREYASWPGAVAFYRAIEDSSRSAAASLVSGLTRLNPQARSLLDLGCGPGFVLESAIDQGLSSLGVEVCSELVDDCCQRGLRVHRSQIESASTGAHCWDIVVLSQVLEHVDDPLAVLKVAADAVAANGIVYIGVPRFDWLERMRARVSRHRAEHLWLPESHLYYFTTNAMVALVNRAGMSMVDNTLPLESSSGLARIRRKAGAKLGRSPGEWLARPVEDALSSL